MKPCSDKRRLHCVIFQANIPQLRFRVNPEACVNLIIAHISQPVHVSVHVLLSLDLLTKAHHPNQKNST